MHSESLAVLFCLLFGIPLFLSLSLSCTQTHMLQHQRLTVSLSLSCSSPICKQKKINERPLSPNVIQKATVQTASCRICFDVEVSELVVDTHLMLYVNDQNLRTGHTMIDSKWKSELLFWTYRTFQSKNQKRHSFALKHVGETKCDKDRQS